MKEEKATEVVKLESRRRDSSVDIPSDHDRETARRFVADSESFASASSNGIVDGNPMHAQLRRDIDMRNPTLPPYPFPAFAAHPHPRAISDDDYDTLGARLTIFPQPLLLSSAATTPPIRFPIISFLLLTRTAALSSNRM